MSHLLLSVNETSSCICSRAGRGYKKRSLLLSVHYSCNETRTLFTNSNKLTWNWRIFINQLQTIRSWLYREFSVLSIDICIKNHLRADPGDIKVNIHFQVSLSGFIIDTEVILYYNGKRERDCDVFSTDVLLSISDKRTLYQRDKNNTDSFYLFVNGN